MKGFNALYTGSEIHVTFRARLQETNQRNSLELMMYLGDIVVGTNSWLIHGQYLKLNLSCSLIINDIHSLECSQFGAISTTNPSVSYNDESHMTYPTTADGVIISCHVGYLTWALSSTFLLLIMMAIFGVFLSVKVLRKKPASNNNIMCNDHCSSQMRARCNTCDINTDTNYAYDNEIYQEMKPSSENDQCKEEDYEEIHNIGKKAEDFD